MTVKTLSSLYRTWSGIRNWCHLDRIKSILQGYSGGSRIPPVAQHPMVKRDRKMSMLQQVYLEGMLIPENFFPS
nr:hypothetical protein CFP56_64611 [Quercus suber]